MQNDSAKGKTLRQGMMQKRFSPSFKFYLVILPFAL